MFITSGESGSEAEDLDQKFPHHDAASLATTSALVARASAAASAVGSCALPSTKLSLTATMTLVATPGVSSTTPEATARPLEVRVVECNCSMCWV